MKAIVIDKITHIEYNKKVKLFDFETKSHLFYGKYVLNLKNKKKYSQDIWDIFYDPALNADKIMEADIDSKILSLHNKPYISIYVGKKIVHTEYFDSDNLMLYSYRLLRGKIDGNILTIADGNKITY